MKKFLVSVAFITFLGLSGIILDVRAGEPGIDGAELNGDTNCDGARDLSDAITLLNWLYVGGRRPCPLAEPVGLREQVADLESRLAERDQRILDLEAQLERTTLEFGDQLADANSNLAALRLEVETLQAQAGDCCEQGPDIPPTGQTVCYDNQGLELPCNNRAYPGQDGFYQNGCPADGRFVDNEDGTVTDNCTNLMWQKTMGPTRSWGGALQYCETLNLGGSRDWRLPNIFELITLIDFGKGNCGEAGVVPDAMHSVFGDGRYGTTWSSTTSICRPDQAWYVWFHEGKVDHDVGKNNSRGFRAVRNIQIGDN